MGTRLRFDFFGETQVDRTLTRISDAAKDMRPAWDELADQFVEAERRQFESVGRAGSGGWAPLSPKYAAWKARLYPGKTILRRTDSLYRSLTQRPLPIERITEKDMVIGSDSPYGGFHQGGDGVPVRKPVDLTESTRRDFVKTAQRHLFGGRG